jgi:hypothetical protein
MAMNAAEIAATSRRRKAWRKRVSVMGGRSDVYTIIPGEPAGRRGDMLRVKKREHR